MHASSTPHWDKCFVCHCLLVSSRLKFPLWLDNLETPHRSDSIRGCWGGNSERWRRLKRSDDAWRVTVTCSRRADGHVVKITGSVSFPMRTTNAKWLAKWKMGDVTAMGEHGEKATKAKLMNALQLLCAWLRWNNLCHLIFSGASEGK